MLSMLHQLKIPVMSNILFSNQKRTDGPVVNLRFLTRVLLLTGLVILISTCRKSDPDPVSSGTEVRMGAILDLSGDYSEEGKNGKAAIELALTDLNALHQQAGSPYRFTVTFTDTHLDTIKTIEAAQNFYQQGIRLLVAGPNNSAGVNAIKSYVDQNQMISLGCFSSSPSLSIAGDNIFRLITDDNAQGNALVRMFHFDSLKALVVVWRDDTYGNGLYQVVKERFTTSGGTLYDGVHFNPAATDFPAMVQQLKGIVSQAIASHGANRTGVLLISYQEAAEFLNAAAGGGNELSAVKWYGCDANAQKSSVTSNPAAAEFASTVRFLAPIMAIGTADGLPPAAMILSSRISAITGSTPDAYALSAYDAVMIMGQCYDLTGRPDATAIKSILPAVCASYDALGIQRTLNEAGDLASANYIFWTVKPDAGGYMWDSYATWITGTDDILLKDPGDIGTDPLGILDHTFNESGYALFSSPTGGSARGVETEIQSDGKIIVMGYAANGSNLDIMLLRYHPGGNPDNTFGTNGYTLFPGPGGLDDKGLGLAVNPLDDEIVVTGFTYAFAGNREILTARFNKDGALQSSAIFSGYHTDIGFGTAFQPDGKILVCGESRQEGNNQELILLRYNNDLSIDETFGDGGKVLYNPGADAKAFGVTMQGNDKIIVCGTELFEGRNHAIVLRYTLSGVPDVTFGNGGVFRWSSSPSGNDFGNELLMQPDGKILVAGNSVSSPSSEIFVLRLFYNGAPDHTFGIGGVSSYTSPGGYAQAYGIAVSPISGKIAVCGSAAGSANNDGLVLCISPNGQLDQSFATGGAYLFNGPHGNTDMANGIFIQGDRKIVVTGFSSNGSTDEVLTLRLQ